MSRRCKACGTTLPHEAPHYVTFCKPCFANSKRDEEKRMREDLDQWRARALRAEARLNMSDSGKRGASNIEGFTKRSAMALIKLCHPDKHGGDAEANRITAWLLKLRSTLPE
jgi:hypothetical protein